MSHNPSIQCATCGKWMRLHGRTSEGNYYQRFYPCYETTSGEIRYLDEDVCVPCESKLPDWKPYPHPMLKEATNVR